MDFDVFLCHNGIDKPAVKKIGEQLKEQSLLPWLDVWELRPGLPWVDFRKPDSEPMDNLIWGITGRRKLGR